jgi:hypothetical protein
MTLIVHPYRRGPNGEVIRLEAKPSHPHNDLAGFEASRHRLWGAPVMLKLGLELLPSLAEYDLYVENEQLDQLKAELETILAALPELTSATHHDEEFIRFRVGNIAEAIRLARAAGGGVYIG